MRKLKTSRRITIAAIIVVFTLSCKENKNRLSVEINAPQENEQTADITDISFSDEMTEKVFNNYQQLRTALANSNAEEVRTAAENFPEERENMKLIVLAMAETDDLEKQREMYSAFTEKVEPMFNESFSKGTIYKQFRPMGFEGKAEYWISDVDEIHNPNYGDKMLKCGTVTAKISK